MGDWQVLAKEQTFTTDATGSYPLSTLFTDGDYERFITDTEWDRTNQRKVTIITPADWQFIQSGVFSFVGINRYGRVRGDSLLLDPDDSTGQTLVTEYISSFYAESSGGTRKATFTADDDIAVFDETLVKNGAKAYIKSEKGLPAEEDFDRYYDAAEKKLAQDRPRKIIRGGTDLNNSRFLVNIPDTGVGQ